MSNTFYEESSNISRQTEALEESDNVLDQLKAVIEKNVKRPDILLNVPERPGVTLLISPNVTQNQIKAWQKNSGMGSGRQTGILGRRVGLSYLSVTANVRGEKIRVNT